MATATFQAGNSTKTLLSIGKLFSKGDALRLLDGASYLEIDGGLAKVIRQNNTLYLPDLVRGQEGVNTFGIWKVIYE